MQYRVNIKKIKILKKLPIIEMSLEQITVWKLSYTFPFLKGYKVQEYFECHFYVSLYKYKSHLNLDMAM